MKKNEKSLFNKFLIAYVVFLIVLMIIFLLYVADSLIKYEANQIDNYIDSLIGNIEEYIDVSKIKLSNFEKDNVSVNQSIKEVLNNKKITHKLNDNSSDEQNPIYDIYADEEKILEVKLDGSQKENRLGLLTFNRWKTINVESNIENSMYTYNVSVPSNCTVYINNKQLIEDQIITENQEDGLIQISKYINIPYIVKYEIAGLLNKPDVRILDKSGNEVEYKENGNTFSKELDFISADTEEDAKKNIKGEVDILTIAKDWSLYLSDDLNGRLHGYDNIRKYLIKDSDLEKFAHKWATGVDITFVSSHTLLNPTFTDISISDFEIYNENAFSCEVYLQKNLKLKSGGKIIKDKMNERMFFAYYDETNDGKDNPTWKLVNMQSITDNN